MTDVLLFQTINDGDISVDTQGITLTDGLESSVYLSMFGGNEDDVTWWGNLSELDPVNQYIGQTAKAIRVAVATPSRVLPIKDAVEADLAWLTAGGFAQTVEVVVGIPRVNTISISVTINSDTTLEFTQAGPNQ